MFKNSLVVVGEQGGGNWLAAAVVPGHTPHMILVNADLDENIRNHGDLLFVCTLQCSTYA